MSHLVETETERVISGGLGVPSNSFREVSFSVADDLNPSNPFNAFSEARVALLLITNIFSNVLKELNFSYVVFTCMARVATLVSSVVTHDLNCR